MALTINYGTMDSTDFHVWWNLWGLMVVKSTKLDLWVAHEVPKRHFKSIWSYNKFNDSFELFLASIIRASKLRNYSETAIFTIDCGFGCGQNWFGWRQFKKSKRKLSIPFDLWTTTYKEHAQVNSSLESMQQLKRFCWFYYKF